MARGIKTNIAAARLESRPVRRFFSGRRRKEEARTAFERLLALVSDPDTIKLNSEMAEVRQRLSGAPDGPTDVWDDYTARPVTYNGLLIEIGGLEPDSDASHGFVPEEIVERIRAFDLDTTLSGSWIQPCFARRSAATSPSERGSRWSKSGRSSATRWDWPTLEQLEQSLRSQVPRRLRRASGARASTPSGCNSPACYPPTRRCSDPTDRDESCSSSASTATL